MKGLTIPRNAQAPQNIWAAFPNKWGQVSKNRQDSAHRGVRFLKSRGWHGTA